MTNSNSNRRARQTKLPLNSDMKYVEHSGNSIRAGRDSLKDLEEQMRQLALSCLKRTEISLTESQARDEASRLVARWRTWRRSSKTRWIRRSRCLPSEAAKQMAEISRSALISIWTLAPTDSLDVLLKANLAGKISDETLFNELQRRGAIADDYDWETERERLQMQAPALGTMTDANGQRAAS